MSKLLIMMVFFVSLLVSALLLFSHGFDPLLPEKDGRQGEAMVGGAFELTDPEGKAVTDQDFRGRYMLVFFGFTSCPDICPLTLTTVSRTMELLGDRAKQVAPVFITVDPARDTPERMKAYLAHFDGRLVGLTGTDAQIAQAASAYKVYYARAPGGDAQDYMMDHSGYLYLMSPQGRYLRHFSHDESPETIAKAIAGYK